MFFSSLTWEACLDLLNIWREALCVPIVGFLIFFSNFSLSHHILLSNCSTFAALRYFKLNFFSWVIFYCIYKFHILYWLLLNNYLFTNYFTHYLLLHLWICKLQVILTGDVELNLSTKPSSGHNLPVCHWNLNSIPENNFSYGIQISTKVQHNMPIWNIFGFQYYSTGS